jgi:D-alanyl-D-alanine carboxypeptidase
MMSRKSLALLGFSLVSLHLLAGGAAALSQPVNARGVIVINVASGKVLYEQNADAAVPPASITKILTLYLVHEAIREGRVHLWDRVSISSKAANTGGSKMFIQAQTEVTLEELIKGMAVDSGNDACVAAAEHLAGNVADFVFRMNRKAQELGMTHSHFENTNGLPARGQVTTARDMARLSLAYLQRFPEALRIHSMQHFTYNGVTQHNRNRLLGKCPGVDGIKTGWVAASGYNLVATAKRGDTRLLTVVLGAPNPGARAKETTRLIEVGYQKLALGSPVIEVADLASQPCDDGPPPTRTHRVGKSAKAVAAHKTKAKGTTRLAGAQKSKSAKQAGGSSAAARVVANSQGQSSKKLHIATKVNAKQQTPAKPGKTSIARHASAKPVKQASVSKKAVNAQKAPCDPKKVAQNQPAAKKTASKAQKVNNAKKGRAEEPAKKGKAQIVKRSSEHS